MSDRKSWLAVVVGVGLVLNGCAWMSNRTRTENALIAAAACGIPAAVAGGLVANNNDANVHMRVPAGAAAGLFGGALICGGLAYLLTPEPPPPCAKAGATTTTTATATATTAKTTATAATSATATGAEGRADDHPG